MDKSRHIKKEVMLKALENSLGVVTVACKQTDTPRSTYYKWLKEDKEFAKAVKEIENIALDFAESQLHTQMKDGNTSATSTTLATADRFVCNDNGTMKQVSLANLVTFLEDGSTSGFDINGGTY